MFAAFGPGSLYITRTDLTNQTPYNIGFCNEFSIDLSADTKELYGQNQYPLAVARGTIKATGKAKAAMISGLALNAAFHAGTFSSGSKKLSQNEAGTIPTTPFQITVANGATFDKDLGVVNSATGIPLQFVASGPTTGQYALNSTTGVYTFAAADTGNTVQISYSYTVAGTGQSQTIANQAIGVTPTFQVDYITQNNGNTFYLRLFQAVSAKLSFGFKLTDFMMPELDFGFFANTSGNVYLCGYADKG